MWNERVKSFSADFCNIAARVNVLVLPHSKVLVCRDMELLCLGIVFHGGGLLRPEKPLTSLLRPLLVIRYYGDQFRVESKFVNSILLLLLLQLPT